MGWLKGWLTGGADELGWDDLVARIAEAIAGHRQFGRKGVVAFPAELQVTVVVPSAHLELVRRFVGEPDLDRRVQTELANRCDCEPSALPLCTYSVHDGDQLDIRIEERAAIAAWQIEIVGGDRNGVRLALPSSQREL